MSIAEAQVRFETVETTPSTLNLLAKNMATVQTDGSVKITIGTYTTTVAAGVVSNGTGGSGNGGSGNGGGSTT